MQTGDPCLHTKAFFHGGPGGHHAFRRQPSRHRVSLSTTGDPGPLGMHCVVLPCMASLQMRIRNPVKKFTMTVCYTLHHKIIPQTNPTQKDKDPDWHQTRSASLKAAADAALPVQLQSNPIHAWAATVVAAV